MNRSALPPKAAYDRAAIGYHDALKAIQQSSRDGVISQFVADLRYEWLRKEYGQAGRPQKQLGICQAVIQMCEDDYRGGHRERRSA